MSKPEPEIDFLTADYTDNKRKERSRTAKNAKYAKGEEGTARTVTKNLKEAFNAEPPSKEQRDRLEEPSVGGSHETL